MLKSGVVSTGSINHPIVFYDGVCGLCDRSIQFLIKHDKKQRLRYAALQSEVANSLLGSNRSFDSFILYNKQKIYKRSSAAIRVMWLIGGWWRVVILFYMIPPFVRNTVYNYIANNRYRWFGKFDACKIPTPEQRKLFIDHEIA